MEKNELIEYLSDKAIAAIASAQKELESIGDGVRVETHILNAQYLMGKYHAFIEVVEDVEQDKPDKWLSIVESTETARDIILKGIQKIYERN